VWVHYKQGKRDEAVRNIDLVSSKKKHATTKMTMHCEYQHVNSFVMSVSEDLLDTLRNDPNVESVKEDANRFHHRFSGGGMNRLPSRNLLEWQGQAKSWGIDAVGAKYAWDQGYTGDNITVCVIDTGFALDHEDFNADNFTGDSLDEFSFWYNDTDGHGTHVAGIIAGANNQIVLVGIAPRARIHSVKVFDDYGFAYSSALVDAAYKCRDAGAKIISMSLGGPEIVEEERDVFTELYAQDGILSSASSGNDGGSSYSYPASYENVLSVGAIDSTFTVTYFSQ
jgi:serine protease